MNKNVLVYLHVGFVCTLLFFTSFFFFFPSLVAYSFLLLFFFSFWFKCTLHIFFFFSFAFFCVFFFFWLFVIFLVLIGHHFQQGYMSKFIQTHFFHIFALLTKQKWGKLKYFLSSHFSTISTKWTLRVTHFLYHRFLTNLTVEKIALNDYCFPPYLPK